MYEALNPRWASTLLGMSTLCFLLVLRKGIVADLSYGWMVSGCVALLLMPIPFVLIKYGPALRAKSKFVPSK